MRDPRPPDRSSARRREELRLTELDRKIAHAGQAGVPGPDGVSGGVGAPGQFNLMTSGRWYMPSGGGRSQTAIVAGKGRTTAVPFFVSVTTVFSYIGIEVFTPKTSGLIRLGVYADTGHGSPGALVRDAGTIDASHAADQTEALSPALTLPGAIYWLAACDQSTGVQPVLNNLKDGSYCVGWIAAATSLPATVFTPAMAGYVSTDDTNSTGGLPNPFPAVFQAASAVPLIVMFVQ